MATQFSASIDEGDAPLTVNFSDETGGGSSWLWDFGDGNTSTQQNPSHAYTDNGAYDVSLSVDGGTPLVKTNFILVFPEVPQKPVITSPVDGATDVSSKPNFQWNGEGDSYQIQISDVSNFSNLVVNEVANNSTFTPTGALPDGTYYARTRGKWAITPYKNNQRYWQYKGQPTLFLGASRQDNLFQWENLSSLDGFWSGTLAEHLDMMVDKGANYVRNTMSTRDTQWGGDDPRSHPFGTDGSGNYDLTTWNTGYWDRFENLIKMAYARDILVQIELFDRFDFTNYYSVTHWGGNAWNPKNNINYTSAETGIQEDITTHPNQNENNFFRTLPELMDIPVVLGFQEDFVRKILSYTFNYPNVLYVIRNETSASPIFSDHFANLIRSEADTNKVEVHVTEMWDDWDLTSAEHDNTFDKPDLYTYADLSQNSHQTGQTNWDNAQFIRNNDLGEGGRPMNSTKLYGGPDYGPTADQNAENFWKNIIGGFATSRFHRGGAGIPITGLGGTMIESARMFLQEINIFECVPSQVLLSNRVADEAYCAANGTTEYAVFFPDGGSVNIDLAGNDYTEKWLDVDNLNWTSSQTITGTSNYLISPPSAGRWVVTFKQI